MLKLAVVLTIIACAHAALMISPLEEKPAKFKDQEGCYIQELDAVIPLGQSRPSNKQCREYRCGGYDVIIATCGSSYVSPPCTMIADISRPYPHCCPRVSCP